jgi:hypothetical protein
VAQNLAAAPLDVVHEPEPVDIWEGVDAALTDTDAEPTERGEGLVDRSARVRDVVRPSPASPPNPVASATNSAAARSRRSRAQTRSATSRSRATRPARGPPSSRSSVLGSGQQQAGVSSACPRFSPVRSRIGLPIRLRSSGRTRADCDTAAAAGVHADPSTRTRLVLPHGVPPAAPPAPVAPWPPCPMRRPSRRHLLQHFRRSRPSIRRFRHLRLSRPRFRRSQYREITSILCAGFSNRMPSKRRRFGDNRTKPPERIRQESEGAANVRSSRTLRGRRGPPRNRRATFPFRSYRGIDSGSLWDPLVRQRPALDACRIQK